jgi:hypothetical protein
MTYVCRIVLSRNLMKGEIWGDREILETYLNLVSKMHEKQTFFLMGQNLYGPVLFDMFTHKCKSLQTSSVVDHLQNIF